MTQDFKNSDKNFRGWNGRGTRARPLEGKIIREYVDTINGEEVTVTVYETVKKIAKDYEYGIPARPNGGSLKYRQNIRLSDEY